jgi:hypothetical protein
MKEHPVEQEVKSLWLFCSQENGEEGYTVGSGGVTRIEKTTKSGLHNDIAYFRIWKDGECLGEFCQHNIVGVTFFPLTEAV